MYKIFKLLILATLGVSLTGAAWADEYTVSGNGEGSNSSINVSSSTDTNVNQTNDASVTNDISQDANTGDNSASSNTGGETGILTGDAQTSSSVSNEGINSNYTNYSCNCESSHDAKISGNGSNSTNIANLSINNNLNVYQENSAKISNDIYNYSNTGYNTANGNGGDVSIVTGNAFTLSRIFNDNINLNFADLGIPQNLISVFINGNGTGSFNFVDLLFNENINYDTRNYAVVFNDVENFANTGGNVANDNNGSVLIATGDAVSIVDIANTNINGSFAKITCCKEISSPPPNVGGDNPPVSSPTSSPTNGGSSIQSAAGQVLGAAIGGVLPETGGYWLLFMTVLCLTMFLAGWYLRFGSGKSPPFTYAI